MRVNSTFIVKSGIFIVMLAAFFTTSSFTDASDRNVLSKEVNIIIRDIGHRLLLQAGDSTSRVLPVTEVRKGTFVLRFENKFVFNHDSLQLLSKGLLPKTKFPSGFIVTVHDCKTGDIVYGFQVNNRTPDILACAGRKQPSGCYTMEFVFPHLYKNIKQEASLKPEGLNISNNVVYAGILALLIGSVLIWRFWKNVKPAPAQHQDHDEPAPALPVLGKFLFNVKGQHLLLGDEVISLTDKECKILELLHKHFGELIPRETLMQEIWINEGVITGRSLDMFVSKLRKKLSPDPELRITNVHAKGYKLEKNPLRERV